MLAKGLAGQILSQDLHSRGSSLDVAGSCSACRFTALHQPRALCPP